MTLAKLIPRLLVRAKRQPNGCLTIECKKRYLDVVFDGRSSRAHCAIWEHNCGPIPEGMEVCHSCDNTRCIEIKHLLCATHAWNMADRDRKGRNGTLGEASPLHKLTADKVLAIYALTQQGHGFDQLAGQFSISRMTVRRIAERKTWKHLLRTAPDRVELTDRLSVWKAA